MISENLESWRRDEKESWITVKGKRVSNKWAAAMINIYAPCD